MPGRNATNSNKAGLALVNHLTNIKSAKSSSVHVIILISEQLRIIHLLCSQGLLKTKNQEQCFKQSSTLD